MTETQEHVTKDVAVPMESVDEGGRAAVEDTAPNAPAETSGGVRAIVGMMAGGFAIAAAAGFIAGFVTGVTVARFAAPSAPPRWQMWR